MACRRCGCEHDGAEVAEEAPKRRGQRSVKFKNGAKKKQKRQANTYERGSFFESPIAPNTCSGRFTLSSAFPSTNPDVLAPQSGRLADLLKVCGVEDNVDYIYAHMPPAKQRSEATFWKQEDDNYAVNAAKSVIEQLTRSACAVFCGKSTESGDAGAALYDAFLTTQTPSVTDESGKHFLITAAECYTAAKKSSVEKRVLRACLSSFSRSDLQKLSAALPSFTLSADGFSSGRQDLKAIRDGCGILKISRSVIRCDPTAIEKAVAFILSPSNISFLSWGTKKVMLDGKTELLPAIIRRRSRTVIYAAYLGAASKDSIDTTLSRATFFRIVSAITAGGTRLQKAVDYVVGFLVNDPFDTLKKVAVSLNLDIEHTLKYLEVARVYLKYGFDARVKDDTAEPCLLHDIAHGLGGSTDVRRGERSICEDCKSVFYCYDHLKLLVVLSDLPTSTVQVIDDCSEKSMLFLDHRLRVINQQTAIQRLLASMSIRYIEPSGSDEALITLDFKMKLEPLYYREKTVDHYGKRGISWHEALVQYFEFNDGSDSGKEPNAVDQKMYFGHVSKEDTKQDRDVVISLVEAVLIRLRTDLPHIKKVSILSDNAACYQNLLLPLVLPYLAFAHGIAITRIIHTETQDGKSVLDAHYVKAMQVSVSWVMEGHNCITPTQAVIGLKCHGGLPNCVVELVERDYQSINAFVPGRARVTQHDAQSEEACANTFYKDS